MPVGVNRIEDRSHVPYLQAVTEGRSKGGRRKPPRANQENRMSQVMKSFLRNEEGQDVAEYAVMLAVILVIVIGTIRLIGGNANNVFSQVASSIQ